MAEGPSLCQIALLGLCAVVALLVLALRAVQVLARLLRSQAAELAKLQEELLDQRGRQELQDQVGLTEEVTQAQLQGLLSSTGTPEGEDAPEVPW